MNKFLSFIIFLFLFSLSYAQVSDFKSINFTKANTIANSHKGKNLDDLPLLSYNLTHELTTDVEKFKAIYLWVCTNIENDYYSSNKNISNRRRHQNDSVKLNQWNETYRGKIFETLLKKKKTICSGYAYLVKRLANLANLECEIINGYGITENQINEKTHFPNHTWNAVKLNNKWYLCDATWSAGSYNLETDAFDFKYHDGYFLTEPELFSKNHYPLDKSWFLYHTNTSLEQFYNAPLLYNTAYNEIIFPLAPETMSFESKVNSEIPFALKKSEFTVVNTLLLHIHSNSDVKIVAPKLEHATKESIKFKHVFEKRGKYDVHIIVNGKIVCTYVIKVTQ